MNWTHNPIFAARYVAAAEERRKARGQRRMSQVARGGWMSSRWTDPDVWMGPHLRALLGSTA
jgi:hypothetical protein